MDAREFFSKLTKSEIKSRTIPPHLIDKMRIMSKKEKTKLFKLIENENERVQDRKQRLTF